MMKPLIDLLKSQTCWESWIWEASWQATLLAVFVLAAQWMMGRRIPARWRHALWLVVFIRLLAPALPMAQFSAYNWLPKASAGNAIETPKLALPPIPAPEVPLLEASIPESTVLETPVLRKPVASRQISSPSPTALLSIVWVVGSLGMTIAGAAGYALLRRRITFLRRSTPPTLEQAFAILKEELNVRADLLISEAVTTPLVTGLLKPCVVLPPDLEQRLQDEEIRMILLHELAHVKRWDLWMAWLAWLVGVIHWFNPAVWFALARERRDREMACDEWVLKVSRNPSFYGSTLVRCAESCQVEGLVSGAVGIFETRSALLQRVRNIMAYRGPSRLRSFAGLAVLATVGVFTLTAATEPSPTFQSSLELNLPPQAALEQALANRDMAAATKALDAGAKVTLERGEESFTPLYNAVMAGQVKIIELFASRDATLPWKSTGGSVLLEIAIHRGQVETARLLKKLGAEGDPLAYAAITGNFDEVQALKPKASKKALHKAMESAAAVGEIKVLADLLGTDTKLDSLFESAASGGSVEGLRFLMDRGADVKKLGADALSSAISGDHGSAVAFLLAQGVAPNGTKPFTNTPLHYAANEGATAVAEVLLKAGADWRSMRTTQLGGSHPGRGPW